MGKKGRCIRNILIKLLIYLAIWGYEIYTFHNDLSDEDVMGWVITDFWIVMPLLTVIISLLIEKDVLRVLVVNDDSIANGNPKDKSMDKAGEGANISEDLSKKILVINVLVVAFFGLMLMAHPLLTFGAVYKHGIFAYIGDSLVQLMTGVGASIFGISIGSSTMEKKQDNVSN